MALHCHRYIRQAPSSRRARQIWKKYLKTEAPGYCYTRVANPTITAFENRITKLEGGIASVACASGMAALMNTFLNILSSGDELISSASLYGGTIDLFHDL